MSGSNTAPRIPLLYTTLRASCRGQTPHRENLFYTPLCAQVAGVKHRTENTSFINHRVRELPGSNTAPRMPLLYITVCACYRGQTSHREYLFYTPPCGQIAEVKYRNKNTSSIYHRVSELPGSNTAPRMPLLYITVCACYRGQTMRAEPCAQNAEVKHRTENTSSMYQRARRLPGSNIRRLNYTPLCCRVALHLSPPQAREPYHSYCPTAIHVGPYTMTIPTHKVPPTPPKLSR